MFETIASEDVTTDRLTARVLRSGSPSGTPVVFVHGNVSSSLFWQPTMAAMPESVHAVAIDLRGFGGSQTLPVDATRGVRDFSDDVASVIRALGLGASHLVGWSMGGGVVMQLALDHPELVASMTLVATVSPYGFGVRAEQTASVSRSRTPGAAVGAATRTSWRAWRPGTPPTRRRRRPGRCSATPTWPTPRTTPSWRTCGSPRC